MMHAFLLFLLQIPTMTPSFMYEYEGVLLPAATRQFLKKNSASEINLKLLMIDFLLHFNSSQTSYVNGKSLLLLFVSTAPP